MSRPCLSSGFWTVTTPPITAAQDGANPLPPDLMPPAERLDEVARLLALGYLRLRARRQAEKTNDPNHLRGFGLDFRGVGSVSDTDAHADRERR
jgi:hypothetical protein